MTDREKCESCVHAKPFGGSNDNRCGAWECEYINRAEAIKIWRANKDIVQCKDCTHSKEWYRDRRLCYLWAEEGVSVFEDGYCSYGERRADDR